MQLVWDGEHIQIKVLNQCWIGIVFFWYQLGIYNGDFIFFDEYGYGYGYVVVVLYQYHSRLYTMQELSNLGKITLVWM